MVDPSYWVGRVIGAALEVMQQLGPGLLKSTYEECLAHELKLRKVPIRVNVPIPLSYKGHQMDEGFRLELLVANTIVVEIKTSTSICDDDEAHMRSYLKHTKYKMGLLINFHAPNLKKGFRQVEMEKHRSRMAYAVLAQL